MTCQVHHKDSKTGRVYVYQSESTWDKEKKTCVCKRTCLGHIDEETKQLVPNRKRDMNNNANAGTKTRPIVNTIGTTLILNTVNRRCDLYSVLSDVFPNTWEEILTCAYYLASENAPLCHCEKWSTSNATPGNQILTSQHISKLLTSINRNDQMRFFKKWAEKINESEYFALDITSISSYSQLIELVKWGYNRDNEDLPQINMAMLVGIHSSLPVYFEPFAGNITDITTLNDALRIFDWLRYKILHLVMDKGFSSYINITSLYEHKYKFTIGLSKTLNFTKMVIAEVQGTLCTYENFIKVDNEQLYAKTVLKNWEGHRCYVHVYFNAKKQADDKAEFLELIHQCEEELKSNNLNKKHQSYYNTYFTIKETPKRGRKIIPNIALITSDSDIQSGYFVLMSNDLKSAKEALEIYRTKDTVEKSFDNFKNTMDGNRLRIHSTEALSGRLFIQFIAQILLAELKRELRTAGKADAYTLRDIFWEMKSMSMVRLPGKKTPTIANLTTNQKDILEILDLDPDKIGGIDNLGGLSGN